MFVRFRQQAAGRLQVSLIETRREGGKVRHEHIAGLGSIAMPPTVADRVEFWRRLHERLGQLSNRLDAAAQGKVLGEVHAKNPMVTVEEIRAVQLENAEADERLWANLADTQAEAAEGNEQLAAAAGRNAVKARAEAEASRANAEAAKDRVERIKKGDVVPGGIGKPVDLVQVLHAAGWTAKDRENAVAVATISELGGFEELLHEIGRRHRRAERAATRAVLRRRLRL